MTKFKTSEALLPGIVDGHTLEDMYIHQELQQQSNVLHHLLKLTKNIETNIDELLKKLDHKQKNSYKVNVVPSRRNMDGAREDELILAPIVRIVKGLPRSGRLFAHVISDEIKNQFEPFEL